MTLPASSRPIIMSKPPADHDIHAPSPSNIDNLGLFLALSIICLWKMNRMTAIRFANSDIRLPAAPITVAEELAQQGSYLRFTTLLGVATANILDANDANLDPARPRV